MIRRIVLGTVQLGVPYGRRKEQDLLPRDTAFAILDAAWDAGVRAFDTAEAYGAAAKRLAEWLSRTGHRPEAHVVTKVAPGKALERRSLEALERFADAARRTIVTHGPVATPAWSIVREVAGRSGAEAGLSLYTAAELVAAVRYAGVVRIQAPGNLFDTRALAARSGKAVRLDLRSVYLQGTLVERPESAERRAPGTGRLARAVQAAATEVGVAPGALLIAAMLRRLGPGDRLVIGADAAEQIRDLTQGVAVKQATIERFEARVRALVPGTIAASTLDPRTWRSTSQAS